MTLTLAQRKQFYRDLLSGFGPPVHGVWVFLPGPGDVRTFAHGSLEERAQTSKARFLLDLEAAAVVGDDRIPMLHASSGTEVFAAAYGSPVYRPADDMPFALPAVYDAPAADGLAEPDIFVGPLGEIFHLADRLVEECGTSYPVRICDIQSPFDIAALIWQKEAFFMALLETPRAVHRLLQKVTNTLVQFINEFKRRYPEVCLVHHPNLWMPADWGICLSEDDIGSISVGCFEEFCLPYLQQLAMEFGGIGMHSCAAGQHQWPQFRRLPGLRYLNLSHPPTSLAAAIEQFSGHAVLAPGGSNEHTDYLGFVRECLALARPDTRFLFAPSAADMAQARELTQAVKELCGRDTADEQAALGAPATILQEASYAR